MPRRLKRSRFRFRVRVDRGMMGGLSFRADLKSKQEVGGSGASFAPFPTTGHSREYIGGGERGKQSKKKKERYEPHYSEKG